MAENRDHEIINGGIGAWLAINTMDDAEIRAMAIEECASLIQSGAGMADLIDQELLDQQAEYIRALILRKV